MLNANLANSKTTFAKLAQDKKSILQEKGRENLKTNVGNNQRLSIVDKGKEHNTRDEIAKDLGWSTGRRKTFPSGKAFTEDTAEKRKRIYEKLYPETKHGVNRYTNRVDKLSTLKNFAQDTAEKNKDLEWILSQ